MRARLGLGKDLALEVPGRWRTRGIAAFAAVAAAALLCAPLGGAEQEAGPRRPYALTLDGHRWAELGAQERLAFLNGFLSGAAAAQAVEAAGGPMNPLDRQAARLAEPELGGRLHFRFAPTVYLARLEDYYFYRNRRDRPVAAALIEINHRLLTEHF